MNKKKIVLIIPYFGKKPDYFNLWLKSAEANPDYSFFIYTDLDLPVSENSNVIVKRITFKKLKEKICMLFGSKIALKTPYKLCDYKPAYGLIFHDDIAEFDYWGFCDVDLIFGNLNHFITDDILDKYEKIFYHGHFSLFRNNEKMNKLFLNSYNGVCDFKTASTTNYCCHFDESGTVAHAAQNKIVNMYFDWLFYDVPCWCYEFSTYPPTTEQVVIWNNGVLMRINNSNQPVEIMYAHLQKRKMIGWDVLSDDLSCFGMYRTDFFVCQNTNDAINMLNTPINKCKQNVFYKSFKKMKRKSFLSNVFSGAIKYRIINLTKK